jgi:hypothetical protein
MLQMLFSRRLILTVGLALAAAACAPLLARSRRARHLAAAAVALYGLAEMAMAVWGSVARFRYPAYLGIMEGTVLTHLERLWAGLPLYPSPSSAFVPLAYVPGIYVLSLPGAALFGPTLQALRLPAVLSWLGLGAFTFYRLSRRTENRVAALFGVGLLFSCLGALDYHMDAGFADSPFLLLALLGMTLADRPGVASPIAAAACWVGSFWVKQHGAILGLGGMVYLTWRRGWRATWPSWLAFLAGAPLAYVLLGPHLFGPAFVQFTYFVPRQWMSYEPAVALRLLGFVASFLPALALLSIGACVRACRRGPADAIACTYPFAAATAVLGCLDTGSANNVLAGLTVWSVLLGAEELAALWREAGDLPRRWGVVAVLGASSVGLLTYPPSRALPSGDAASALADLRSVIDGIDGRIYWPMDGRPLLARDRAPMEAEWVALEDLTRGPSPSAERQAVVDGILAPLAAPDPDLYIFSRWPLEEDSVFRATAAGYERVADYKDRFAALAGLQDRFGESYPRLLYRRRVGEATRP